jgi:hypothetical protein
MASKKNAVFPDFTWDEYFWVTTANLPAFAGYQIRGGAYGSISAEGTSDGTVKLLFAPEGRADGPLKPDEVQLVQWVVDHQREVHDGMLNTLFAEYPAIREKFSDWIDEDEIEQLLPVIGDPQELKKLVGVSSINIHQISKDGKPFIGIELGCTWDDEHGVGVLMHGDKGLEVGGADTAILLWIAEQHAEKA